MSDQTKSNVQALGAGLLGFLAVVGIGGGALWLHSTQQSKMPAKPAAAAAPIDLGSSMPAPAQPFGARKESRQESPAPLIGDDPSGKIESVPAASPSATKAAEEKAQAEAQAAAKAAALKATEHLASTGNGSTAEAVVKNTLPKDKKVPAPPLKGAPASKTSATAPGATTDAVASVHYGVTNRSELMGRAAGPVYNVKGGAKDGGAAVDQMKSGDVGATIEGLKKQLESANLPAEQRAAILKQLEAAGEEIPEKK